VKLTGWIYICADYLILSSYGLTGPRSLGHIVMGNTPGILCALNRTNVGSIPLATIGWLLTATIRYLFNIVYVIWTWSIIVNYVRL